MSKRKIVPASALPAFPLSSPPPGASAFSSPPSAFANKSIPQETLSTFHGAYPAAGLVNFVTNKQPQETTISLAPGQLTCGYRFMHDSLTNNGDLLDAKINFFTRLILEQNNPLINQLVSEQSGQETNPSDKDTKEDVLANPSIPKQNNSLYVGRIVCDSLVSDTRLNPHSILLESSRSLSGSRTQIGLEDFLQTSGISLFPGQIAATIASNPSGKSIRPSKFIQPPLPPRPASSISEISSFYKQSSNPIGMVVAAGPFTAENSLDFDPLASLVSQIVSDPPDIVVLIGPFISIDHPLIASGNVTMDVDDLFASQIGSKLNHLISTCPKIKIILIPSTRDATTEYIAFPQPPLASDLSQKEALIRKTRLGLDSPNILLFPNPVQFRINEIVLAVSSTDVLFDMVTLEVARPSPTMSCQSIMDQSSPFISGNHSMTPESLDPIARGFYHVVQQRTFYPVFPASNGVCLDMTRAFAMTMPCRSSDMDMNGKDEDEDTVPGPVVIQVIPDILIIPSKLKYGIRSITMTDAVYDGVLDGEMEVNTTLCVNPGLVNRNRSGGTYARICVHPLNLGEVGEEGEEVVVHGVPQRSAVEIKRI